MEETQRRNIGARLWDLRENSPETNRSVGDAVGVSERTVAEWVAGRQGMTYDHAQGVAQLFGVDLDWFWRGKADEPAPDPFASPDATQLDRIERKLDKVLGLTPAEAPPEDAELSEVEVAPELGASGGQADSAPQAGDS